VVAYSCTRDAARRFLQERVIRQSFGIVFPRNLLLTLLSPAEGLLPLLSLTSHLGASPRATHCPRTSYRRNPSLPRFFAEYLPELHQLRHVFQFFISNNQFEVFRSLITLCVVGFSKSTILLRINGAATCQRSELWH
jgi:hypothetical protein